ncbi:MAG: hypothetical protein QHH06_11255 [Clostridiales bacterium]|jgi:hypothetical protein|nr:hypothetical protein [Eubacteriales bacterium]MDH7567041.1 hypothetical protein [Clostridiales bacterium]
MDGIEGEMDERINRGGFQPELKRCFKKAANNSYGTDARLCCGKREIFCDRNG